MSHSLGFESTKRLEELDSLRGLAALSVVLSHLFGFWRDEVISRSSSGARELFAYLVYPISAGREAVILFFILSGFVLSIPAIKLQAQRYPVFITRRIFRIYFPYLVAIMAAILAAMIFHGNHTQSLLINRPWTEPVTWRAVLDHVLFIGQYDGGQFDPPIWSLVHEMRISLLFPFLCAIVLMLKPGPSLAMAACLSAAAILLNNTFAGQADWHSATNTMHYAALFVVGIFLARQKDFFRSRYGRMSRNGKLAIGLLSAIFYVYAAVLWQGLVRRLTSYDLFNSGDWLTAMGAAGLIVFSLNSARLRRVLLWPPIHALGKMSYSVYLLHLIVILLLVHLFYRKIPLLLLLTLCLVVTIAVSWAFYRFVELPCISLGRRLSGCL